MLDYEYNGEQKHNMLVAHLVYGCYKVNIVYEDYEGSDEKFAFSTNIGDFFESEKQLKNIQEVFRLMLNKEFEKEFMDVKWKIPKYIQNLILGKLIIT